MVRAGAIALAAALALGGLACGSDGAGDGSPASGVPADGEGVTVAAEDITFPEGTYSAEPGPVDITYRNEGSIQHTLVIEDVEGFKLEVAAHGDVDEGIVDLGPGEYTLYCDVAGHREAGMEAVLDVG